MNHQKIDFSKFLVPGEGFAGWRYKTQIFMGAKHELDYPSIQLGRRRSGEVFIKNPSAIRLISKSSGLPKDTINEIISIDIEAVSPYYLLLRSEGDPNDTRVEFPQTAKRICISCFEFSLSLGRLPIFNPIHSMWMATHCLKHRVPLVSIDKIGPDQFDADSQFDLWLRVIRSYKGRIYLNSEEMNVIFPSENLIKLNKLFSPTLLKDEIVGLYDYKATIEALRQKVFGIYYLLWARRGQTSIGSQIRRSSKIVEYRSQFYSFNSLSKVNLEKTKECARSAGLEILLSNPTISLNAENSQQLDFRPSNASHSLHHFS